MPVERSGAGLHAGPAAGLPALRPTALHFLAPEQPPLAPPLRGPLLGMDGFREHARALAQAEPIERRRGWRRARRVPFRPPLDHSLRLLQRAAAHLQALGDAGQPPSAPALALAQQLRRLSPRLPALRQALSARAFTRLPAWRAEPLAGMPRIYGIAWSFVTHTDANLDANLLLQCLLAYQEVDELGIEELQALPLALRAVLLENAARLADAMASREAAAEWADLCVAADDGPPPEALTPLLGRLARRGVDDAFLARLAQGLAQRPPAERRGLRDWLQSHCPDPAAALARWQATQAADEVSLRHTVASLVEVDRLDWPALTDPASVVLQRLFQSEAFCCDDLATRERCLQAVAQVARRMRRPQGEVAQRALELSRADAETRRLGPAQFLIGPQRGALLRALGRPRRLPVLSRRQRSLVYLGGLVLGTLALITRMLEGEALVPWAELLTVLLLAAPASEVVAVLLQRLLATLSPALPLPRLALDDGFQPAHRTLVVVPCVLRSSQQVAVLAQRLEQHWLANRERHTQFALLSDWADAPERQAGGDALLLDAARTALAVLNARHPRSGDDDSEPRFLLLHRERSWSASESAWIGWDRGRGQREQLLAHLAGATPSPFLPLGEDSRLARRIVHVVTLAPDSVLPPGALHELVAVAAHPMNAPVVNEALRRVASGHAVLQPRLAAPLATDPAMQPPLEAPATAGVHQRLFGDSRFLGQGLLHVQAFHAVNAGRVPEDRLPDASLFEGLWARCAEVPEVTLLQSRPVDAEAAHAAQQRRTRLTWQLLPLWPQALHGRVGLLNLWRLLDGLRQSLLAPSCVLLLWWTYTLQPVPPLRSLLLVLAALALRPALHEVAAARGPARWSPRGLATALRWRAPRLASLVAWQFLGLMPRALADADAILRSLWRQAVSRRLLLQPAEPLPRPSADDGGPLDPRLWSHIPDLPAAIAAAVFTLSGLVVDGAAWAWLTVTGLAWLLAPALPGAVAELLERRRHGPDPAQRHLLHLARDSWRAFERLPADDPQALPPEQLALGAVLRPSHRSNPATLGLTLLAAACAHRLGLIGTRDLIQRLGSGLDALERLPRERGHLHQWTDTHTRAVLAPARIDTVQSGVLAACLWATAQACRELAGGPAPHAARETALNAALARLRHGGDPGLRELLQQAPLQALLAQDLWALWRRSPGKLRTLLAAAQVASGAPAPLQAGPLADLLAQLDSLLSDREDDRDRWPARLRSLATRLDALVDATDFTLLYDPHRRLLHTGLRTDDALREETVHDSLLGAARLAGFVGIAKGDLPAAHWAALDRRLPADGADADPGSALAQALLPGLLLDEPPGSVLQRGASAALAAAELPDEGNGQPRRVAPWLALLALPVDPEGALARLQRMERLGARSPFGLVSSLTLPAGHEGRRPPPQPSDTVVLAELAAGLAAITYRLADGAPRRWFGAVPAVRAHLPLLQEPPRPGLRLVAAAPPLPMPAAGREEAPPVRELDPTHLPPAQAPTQLLGNGRYWVALQPHGGGCSRWQGRDVHRWHDDLLRGNDGHWLLLRSGDEVEYHSLTRAPHPRPDAFYRTRFHDDRVEYDADCDFWRTTVTAWVGADEDIEFRQVSLQNLEAHPVAFELLSVVDVSLAPADLPADQAAAQPPLKAEAADAGTLLFKRAADDDGEPWCVAHFLARCDAEPVSLRLIADRRRLLPRRGDLSQARPGAGQGGELPARLDTGGEPVAAIAVRLVVPAQSRLCVTFATSAGRDPHTLRAWADEFRRDVHLQRSRRMASALLRLRQHSWQLDAADHDALQDLCTGLVASRAQARPLPAEPADPQRLARLGLNLRAGAPLLLVRLPSRAGVPAVQTLRRACRAWGAAGLEVMLAVIDATPMDVEQRVLGALPPLRHDLAAEDLGAPQERLHLWRADSLAPEDLAALQAAARVDLVADGQPLARVVSAAWRASTAASRAAAAAAAGHDDPAAAPDRRLRAALVDAPLAGEAAPWRFVDGGRALTLHLDRRRTTPEAWRLSLGGPAFGARVSESGGGHTWAGTPPRPLTTPGEDPLLDPPVEHFLLQDLATRETWGLLPTLDRNGLSGYELRLEPGRARWRQQRGPLAVEAELWVHPEAPAKVLQVRLHNTGPGERVLRAAAMVEWMLGGRRGARLTALNEFVPALPAVLAQQRGGGDDALPGVALLMLVGLAAQQWTAARDEWFDTAGRLRLPRTLAGADGGALDPCAALDATLTLAPGERSEFAWVLAHAPDRAQALALGQALGSLEGLRAAAAQLDGLAPRGVAGWGGGQVPVQVQVQTPDLHFDALVNHWLPWQLRGLAPAATASGMAAGSRAAAVVAAAATLASVATGQAQRIPRSRRQGGPRLTLSPWASFCRASPAHDEADGLRRKPRRAAPFVSASDEAALKLYKLALEGVLGCRLQGERISVAPALPAAWPRALVCLTRGPQVLWLHLREPSLGADGDAALQRLAPGASLAWDELPAESHWLVQSPSAHDAEDRRPPTLVEA